MSKCGPPPPGVGFTKPLVQVIANPGSGELQQGTGGGTFRVLAGPGVERSLRRLVVGGQVGDPFPLQSAARLGFTPLPSRPGVGAYPHQGSGSRLRKLEAQAKLLKRSWAHCGFTPRGHSSCRNEPLTQLYIRMGVKSTCPSWAATKLGPRALPVDPSHLFSSRWIHPGRGWRLHCPLCMRPSRREAKAEG